jgi:hypothetical protein
MTALSLIFGLFRVREAPKKEPLTMLTEQEALEILKNAECIFLKHAYTYISKANEAGSERERIRRLALAESAVEKSEALYSIMGAGIPEKYLRAVQTLAKEFEKREQVRQNLSYRLAIQAVASANPLF